MFTKLICIAALAISCVCAKPGVVAPVAYSAPLVAAPAPAFVTAQSSQVIARNYNGVAPLAYTAAVAAPLAYAAPVAKVAAPLAYSAPLAYTAAAAYAAPFAAPFASPYAAYRYSPYVL
ncbi:cuticle protein 38-like [Ochlerotatus camptorhynchus]|uniref:cuticle protein 38-like n=1 Tax=Ochlerotatus camptorhynchus TaxID=644619 RepID=UPI0031D3EBA4